jgi:hypothetical protein
VQDAEWKVSLKVLLNGGMQKLECGSESSFERWRKRIGEIFSNKMVEQGDEPEDPDAPRRKTSAKSSGLRRVG